MASICTDFNVGDYDLTFNYKNTQRTELPGITIMQAFTVDLILFTWVDPLTKHSLAYCHIENIIENILHVVNQANKMDIKSAHIIRY